MISQIEACINKAKSVQRNSPSARYDAGVTLMNETKPLITKLKKVCASSDMRYQNVMDKLANEILQCGIDYYNKSDDDDRGEKAMPLQQYALQIAVGPMAKSRCKENVDILQKNIDDLPPKEIRVECKNIERFIQHFIESSYNKKGCKDLLFKCEPYLVSIKEKVGANNNVYIEISTLLANVLLSFTIDEFNKKVNDSLEIRLKSDEKRTLLGLMWVARFSWYIILNIQELNTSSDFVNRRLLPNKQSIEQFIKQLDSSFCEDYTSIKSLRTKHRVIQSSPMEGELACVFIKEYFSFLYPDKDVPCVGNFLMLRLSPISGFMHEMCEEVYIDLRIEDDYFKECKNEYLKKTSKCDTYDVYIKKFPNGRFVKQVKEYKEETQKELELYRIYRNSISECNEYIRKYPNGWFIESIKVQLDDLTYKKCKGIHEFVHYIDKFPTGRHISEAKEKYENMLYEQYKISNKLKEYVAKYPNGKHVQEAKKIIKEKKETVLIWIMIILIPSVIISFFVYFEWSVIAAIILSVVVLLCSIGYFFGDEKE